MKNLLVLLLLVSAMSCGNNKTKLFLISKWDVVQVGGPQKKDTAGVDPITRIFSEQTAHLSEIASAMTVYEINGDGYEFHTNDSCDISVSGIKTRSTTYKVSFDGKTLTLKDIGLGNKDQVYEILSIDEKQLQLKCQDGTRIILERNTK